MDTVTSADGTSIAYDQYGSGPAVILVGGAFQHRVIDSSTAELARLLGTEFTAYHYDRRGRGDSGQGASRYTVEREIDDIAALVEAAGGTAMLFGMSSGAALALDAAARRPAVTRVAVYEPPFLVEGAGRAVPANLQPRLEALVMTDQPDGAVELFLTEAVGMPAERVAGLRRAPIWPAFESVAHTLPHDVALLEDTLSGGRLPAKRWAAVTVPVLVVDGGTSPPSMAGAAAALAGVLLDARRETLPGQDHAVDPVVLAPLLGSYFRESIR